MKAETKAKRQHCERLAWFGGSPLDREAVYTKADIGHLVRLLREATTDTASALAKISAELYACEVLEKEYRSRSKKELDDAWITADEISHRMGGLKFAIACFTTGQLSCTRKREKSFNE